MAFIYFSSLLFYLIWAYDFLYCCNMSLIRTTDCTCGLHWQIDLICITPSCLPYPFSNQIKWLVHWSFFFHSLQPLIHIFSWAAGVQSSSLAPYIITSAYYRTFKMLASQTGATSGKWCWSKQGWSEYDSSFFPSFFSPPSFFLEKLQRAKIGEKEATPQVTH